MSRKAPVVLLILFIYVVASCSKDEVKIDPTPVVVLDVAIKTSPDKLIYYKGDKINLTGLVVTLSLSSKETKDYSYEYLTAQEITISPTHGTVVDSTASPQIVITDTKSGKFAIQNYQYISNNLVIVNDAVTDIDGNSYKGVQIGTQFWMAENLKTTHYQNGDEIPTTVPATLDIKQERHPKYQWPVDGDENNVDVYGRLYTAYVARDARKVCPEGWSVPTLDEFEQLLNYLGEKKLTYDSKNNWKLGKTLASKMYWEPQTYEDGAPGKNPEANNRSGFSGVATGARINYDPYYFTGKGVFTQWWSSDTTGTSGLGIQTFMVEAQLGEYGSTNVAGSLRCIKD